MKITQRIGYAAASAVAVAGLIGGGAAVANAASTPSPSPSSSGTAGSGTAQGRGGHQHTDASADETARVTAAVQAKDANAQVSKVMKDEDGSFDAMATSNGTTVRYEVSADYATVTADDHAGRGMGGQEAALTDDELAKVTAAVKAKDAGATIERSWKDSDGSFDVVATSNGTRVKYEVSADYATVTTDTGFGQGHMNDGGGSDSSSNGSSSPSASSGTTQG
ncbi:hypothetical protein [Sinomonas sp. R1AF57]|uniref:hypothetical protein n=1 Tax=Sinomonas sp. R1AF57 TaxID=2020377 RepID=UPI000B6028D8|nr:hypothetical protein [Sinomonas sp. R1AF57]ASN53460.1 hypothetical protein CGQ25_16285 [Sinomonas sp. R1AF57]